MALVGSMLTAMSCSHEDQKIPGAAAGDSTSASEQARPPTDEAAEEEAAEDWPDGYVVVSEAEWIPVINEAGKKLEDAHDHFVAGDASATEADLRAAAKAIREDEKIAQADDKSQLEQNAKDLDRLADQMSRGEVDGRTFVKVLAEAYRSDVQTAWLYSEDDAIRPFLERPSQHSARALALLKARDYAGAAAEIRRSAAFFRLAEASARSDDRESLQSNVDRMNAMAKRAEEGQLTPEELRKTLAKVDAVYAASYLHQAEDDYLSARAEVKRVPRTLREAAARMRSRLRLLDKEMEQTSMSVVEEIETMTKKLESGVEVGKKDASALLGRAHEQVEGDAAAGAKTAPPGGMAKVR
jgi:hypothetical protein